MPSTDMPRAQEAFVREKAAVLEQALKEFEIDAHVVEIDTGPVITMYELALAPGVKVSAISALSNDIQRALKAETVRIVAPIPGKNTVGIEVPNEQKEKVRLKELMQLAPDAHEQDDDPAVPRQGRSGEPLIADLAAMPHCLIAGTTGSGKSVCINTIIMSIMYLQRPGHGEADPGRPQGGGNGAVQGHPAPDVPGHQRDRPGDQRAGVGLREDGRALRVPRRGRRAKHRGVQRAARRRS